MVHNEVSVLERSYEENERKIRGLISELSGERHALVNTSDRVSESLMRLGSEIPTLIEKLSDQQVKLAKVIEGAGENLTTLETSLATSVGSLETAVGGRTEQLQNVLENYTSALGTALGSRAEQMQITFDNQLQQLDTSLGNRTENLQTVFEEYARALDAALANRAQALDYQLVERTRSLDEAFGERLRLVRRVHHALDERHRHGRRRQDAGAHQRARRARRQLPRDHRQAGDRPRRSAHARHQLGAPRFREHHAPVDQGDGRPRRPVRPSEEHLREPAGPDQRRHRPLREPGPADHEGGQRPGDRQLQDRQDAAEPPRRAGADARSSVGQGGRVLQLRRRLLLDHGGLAVGGRPARPRRTGAHACAHQRRERAHPGRSAPSPDLGVDDHDHRARLAVEPLRRHVGGNAPASLARRRRHRRRAGAPAHRDGAPAGGRARKLRGHAPRPARPDQGARSSVATRRPQRRAARRDARRRRCRARR